MNLWNWVSRPEPWRGEPQQLALTAERPSPEERLFPGRIYSVTPPQNCSQEMLHDMADTVKSSGADLALVEGCAHVGVEELDHQANRRVEAVVERRLTQVAGVDGDQVVHVRVAVEGFVS